MSNKERRQLAQIMADEVRFHFESNYQAWSFQKNVMMKHVMIFFWKEKAAEEAAEEAALQAAGELRNFTLELPKDRNEIQSILVEGFSM